MSRVILPILVFLLVASACAPIAPPPTTTPTNTPRPADVPLELAQVQIPPEMSGVLDLSRIPDFDGATTVQAGDALIGLVCGVYNLIPVATDEGVLASEANGRVACAVLTSISRRNPDNPDELQTLILDKEASDESDYWVYSLDGAKQYIPKTVAKPGNGLNVYLAVDLHLDGEGGVYFVAVDEQGHLQKVMEAVSEEEGTGQWRAVQPGEFGLKGHEALLNVSGLTGNEEEITWADDKILGEEARLLGYAFTDETGAVHEYPADQIEWLPLGEKSKISEDGNVLGLVILKDTEGEIEYIWQDGDWQKVTIENLSGGALVFAVADRRLIEVGHRLLAFDPDKFELGVDGENVVVSESGERYTWGENGWGKEGPPVKEFTVCPDIKKYREAYIPAEDLLSGAYHAWLEREFPQEYDLNTIQQVPFARFPGSGEYWIVYDRNTPHNFGERKNRPYVNDLTFGYTEHEGLVYVVMPVNLYDPANPGHGRWVVAVWPLSAPGYEINEATRQAAIDIWLKNYRITPIVMSDIVPIEGYEDPLVAETFKKWPDMASRFQAVLENGDVAQISEPGMVLMTFVVTGAESWFK